MGATEATGQRGGRATPVRLRADLFDRLAASRGAESEEARARLVGCDRTTLWRLRTGGIQPGLALAMDMARAVGASVEQLFEHGDGS